MSKNYCYLDVFGMASRQHTAKFTGHRDFNRLFCGTVCFEMHSVVPLVLNSTSITSVKYFCNKTSGYLICKNLSTHVQEDIIDAIFPDLKGEPQPLPGKYVPSKYRKKERNIKNSSQFKNENIVIECKNADLNHYRSQIYGKFDDVHLASKGWMHKRSKGDYFKIHKFHEKFNQDSVFWKEDGKTFDDLNLEPAIVSALGKMGITKPTNIQMEGIPKVLKSLNTVLAGETGCGKTLAYLLPLVQQILMWRQFTPQRKFNTPLALVLTPSRELTEQIGEVAKSLAEELTFDSHVIVGGRTKKLITNPSFYPMDLLVGSTGAVSKLTTTGVLNMSSVRHVVLDEADTLLDDSFNEQLVYYLKKFSFGYYTTNQTRAATQLPDLCQLTLASATMPTSISKILQQIIDPESLVKVETQRLHHVLVHVPQMFLRLGQSQKPGALLDTVRKNNNKKAPTIIFSNRAATCDWISLFLNENGINCVNLNGDMSSILRIGKFKQFQNGDVDVISCSDIGSRGLDTIRVKHVINYDFPIYMADYVHRCGRVGRIGSSADCAITNFVSGPREVELVRNIEMSVRRMSSLPNVNGNITKIIQHKVLNRDEKHQ